MEIKCIIFNDDNEIIDNACLCPLGGKNGILTPFNDNTSKCFRVGQKIRFQVENRYDKVFDGEMAGMYEGKIRLKYIRDIGPILPRDVRVSVDIPASIFYENDEGYNDIGVRVRNISSGGMCFVCKRNLDMDATYETVVDWVEVPMIVKMRLLRKECDDNKLITYGCSFIDLIQEEEFLLRAGVYDIQARKFRPRRSNGCNEIY